MAIRYKSTRGNQENITSAEAILKGLATDKGLYVPVEFPTLDKDLSQMVDYDYKELAFYILKKFLSDYTDADLKDAIEKAYDEKFTSPVIAPVVKKADAFFLELFHGKTIAFKDMALSILPHLLTKAAKNLGVKEKIVILTATSGDTGKAALEGFANVAGTEIIVFYPAHGVSEVQKRQMVTQEGDNTHVVAIIGNFDDAQRGVKEIFNDKAFNEKLKENNYTFSSANSINIGRLVPQVVYYFHAYITLLKREEIKPGEKINFVVPTGNFGNILAGYYAKKMGLPVNKLICASNENNVLYDFINTGVYDINREFIMTNSPSMDILVSSNLERLLYDLSDQDENTVLKLMSDLEEHKKYEVEPKIKEKMQETFYGGFATQEETLETIKAVYEISNYLIDTHTAVAYNVYEKYKEETKDNTKTVIVATASPYKFTKSVISALTESLETEDEFKLIEVLSKFTNTEIPEPIKDIDKKEILHKKECSKDAMKSAVEEILHI